ncbi:MAG: hypothetical protein GXO71_01395 [Caldiserica bacterium]|nr:hypothetical protein [Caldisericota bacterium]
MIEMGDKFLAMKTDPITLSGDLQSWYLVNVNANDVVTSGAEPRWLLVTALLPEGYREKQAEGLMKDLVEACRELDISLIGGHSEVTKAVSQPTLIGFMVGEGERGTLLTPERVQVGDAIILTKGIAIEGTSIIAREREKDLTRFLKQDRIDRAKHFLFDPGISVVKEAKILSREGARYLHDPTEGGIKAGVYEVGYAAKKGVEVEEKSIHVYPETQEICRIFNLDPYALLASGALLAVIPKEQTATVLERLKKSGIFARKIGKIVEEGYWWVTKEGQRVSLAPSSQDEILK